MNARIIDKFVKGIIWFASLITVGFLAWIVLYIIKNGAGEITWDFIFTTSKGGEEGGILSMIVSTVYIIILSIVIATPIGICSAIYLVEYAKKGKLLRIIRFTTECLAGIPSIIFGLFGFIFFVDILGLSFSIISGSLTLSIMILPTIIRTTEEALLTVPIGYREGSLALGASKLKTIYRVILPCALPGILTAVILSIGRVIGETAAVYFTAGMGLRIPTSVMDSGMTLAVRLFVLAEEGISFGMAYGTACILLLLILTINFATNRLAKRIRRKQIEA